MIIKIITGSWRIIIGGAGFIMTSGSCVIIMSPAGGGVGGFK